MPYSKIVLASSSPRRKEMISWLNIPFEIMPANIEESYHTNEKAFPYVRRLAREKAEKAAKKMGYGDRSSSIVLAADTIVLKGDQILGKPKNEADAERMLVLLRNTFHQVITAICLLFPDGRKVEDLCISEVRMRNYSDDEIAEYVHSGDAFDKAGAYAIQNGTFNPVCALTGCYASVMGFPFCHIERNLRKIDGYNWISTAEICQKHLHYECPISEKVLKGEEVEIKK